MKDKVKKQAKEAQTMLQNAADLADAVAFSAVAVFTTVSAFNHRENDWYKALLLASLVVVFQAARLWAKNLKKR